MITMSSFKYAGLIISIIISLISCTHNKNYPTAFQPELAKAEAMMYRYPDSALHILQGIQPDIPSENEQYATWALLMTQAQYKNQIEQSDSCLNKPQNNWLPLTNIPKVTISAILPTMSSTFLVAASTFSAISFNAASVSYQFYH